VTVSQTSTAVDDEDAEDAEEEDEDAVAKVASAVNAANNAAKSSKRDAAGLGTITVTISPTVVQVIRIMFDKDRLAQLIRLIEELRTMERELGQRHPGPMLVFCNTIDTVKVCPGVHRIELLGSGNSQGADMGCCSDDLSWHSLPDVAVGYLPAALMPPRIL